MAWGRFCDTMHDKSKEGHWLEFLATCYLQARLARQFSWRAGLLERLLMYACTGLLMSCVCRN